MKITIEEILEVRKRLHCSIRRATHVVRREKIYKLLQGACDYGKMSDFKELMTEIIEELYKD